MTSPACFSVLLRNFIRPAAPRSGASQVDRNLRGRGRAGGNAHRHAPLHRRNVRSRNLVAVDFRIRRMLPALAALLLACVAGAAWAFTPFVVKDIRVEG